MAASNVEVESMTENIENIENLDDGQSVIKEEDDACCGFYFGKCKWFSDKCGYGFITVEGCKENDPESDASSDSFPVAKGKEVFVHFTGVKPVNSTYKSLVSGEYVSFDIIKGTKDFQAIHVTGINGGPLMCDTNPNTKFIFPKFASMVTAGLNDGNVNESNNESKEMDQKKNEEKPVCEERPNRYDGRCKWFNDDSGFGFLVIESGDKIGKDVFVHHSGIRPITNGYKTLVTGEYLSFDIIDGVKDIQATNVTGYNGGPIMCDTNHIPKPSQLYKYRSNRRNDFQHVRRQGFFQSPPIDINQMNANLMSQRHPRKKYMYNKQSLPFPPHPLRSTCFSPPPPPPPPPSISPLPPASHT